MISAEQQTGTHERAARIPPRHTDFRQLALQTAREIADSAANERQRTAHQLRSAPDSMATYVLSRINALLAFALALRFVLAPPAWLPQPLTDTRTIAERRNLLRVALTLDVAHIDAFRAQNDRLPETLGEAGIDARDATYALLDASRYTLTITEEAISLRYDSANLPSASLDER